MHRLIGFFLLLIAACGPQPAREPQPAEAEPAPAPAAESLLGDSARARAVLDRYWSHLAEGRYEEAAQLYGGNWRDVARHWVDPVDADTLSTAGFLRHACGGLLVCDLRLGHVLDVELRDPTRLALRVTLMTPSGETFRRGPCCGEEGEPESDYEFVLRRERGDFVVEELPIYVP
jgi:hypothetical protein